MEMNGRAAAYQLLMKIEKGAYSNIALDKMLDSTDISGSERKLAALLMYGVTERRITLDHIISQYSKTPVRKLDSEVRTVLRMGIYQLVYCDKIPQSAAVNESVRLIKSTKKSMLSGFVNGVLRSFIRNDMKYTMSTDRTELLSVRYSADRELCGFLCKGCGEENTERLLESSFDRKRTALRVNICRTDKTELSEILRSDGIDTSECDIDILKDSCIFIDGNLPVPLEKTKAYRKGLFHVQDVSSQLCCMAADVREGDTVADLCAAPGGKSFTLAENMKNRGRLVSCDLHENRVRLIKSGAERLGLDVIDAMCADAHIPNESIGLCDVVLCDVPCSGLGVFSEKPEIKYKKPKEFGGLPQIQYDILCNASGYVREGGRLIYSTCTVNPEENFAVVKRFLEEHSEFVGESFLEELGSPFGTHAVQIYPQHFGSDGFFISRLVRR